ncbi:MAG: sigma-70 family RNA polymerase sigma factor [Kofleriaceae bacterium]|nr:sigma-70 family RNA polymerase sigma factor [Myxococcales bacterium]MCB9559456.1 sigma-70 family RNA polymerase sigma factor [Kofleriaceae bacterium]MCB9574247.1 sigma-70 family RNA polymerase sigma factor [Kofleriaceae bacterium]
MTDEDDTAARADADPDQPLVARFKRGDRLAFDLLVRRHQRGLWRIARRYVGNDADAADVAQQAFVRAYKALPGFRGAATVRSWLYRIAINLALNHVRDRGRETLRAPDELDDDRLATGATGARRLIADEDAAALRDAITALPPKQRMVLELRVYDELSFREVAELADCTENAAKVNFHYAVKRLRELLGAAAGGPP